MTKTVAIVGSGPAALMAADRLAHTPGYTVTILEKRPGPARKLFIAGSSGLNITNVLPLETFVEHYHGGDEWSQWLREFPPQAWLDFIEQQLGIKTFAGTSGRYFVENMKSLGLVRAWRKRLTAAGVTWRFGCECLDFALTTEGRVRLALAEQPPLVFDAVVLALGGGSYEPDETPLRWPRMFLDKSIGFRDFVPANVGFRVAWSPAFLTEAEGKPLKNICLTSTRGSRRGDLVITAYGIEGTPVYFVGVPQVVTLDLKPDLTTMQIIDKLQAVRENLAPLRRAKKQLRLSQAATALLFYQAPPTSLREVAALAACIKALPLELLGPQPIAEAISTAGGVHISELDEQLMLRKAPGVFAAGEMLDWDAPTGGFLIQGCVTQGFRAAGGVLRFFSAGRKTD